MKFYIWIFFETLSRIFKFHQNLTRIRGTSHADQYTFFIISRSFILRILSVSYKSCRENQNTHFMFSNFFSCWKSCRLWDTVDKYCRAGEGTGDYVACAFLTGYLKLQTRTLGIRNTYCFSTATIIARTRIMLRYTCIACLARIVQGHRKRWTGFETAIT